MNQLVPEQNIRDMLNEWTKWGTMFLVSRVLTYYVIDNSKGFTKEWLLDSMFTLLGFSLYYIAVKQLVSDKLVEQPLLQEIIDDWLKYGSMLAGSHVLTTVTYGGTYFNQEWIIQSLFVLIGFTVFRVGKGTVLGSSYQYVEDKTEQLTEKFVPKYVQDNVSTAFSDSLFFGSMLVSVRLLNGSSLMDKEWLLTSLYMILGFISYHLVTKNVVKF